MGTGTSSGRASARRTSSATSATASTAPTLDQKGVANGLFQLRQSAGGMTAIERENTLDGILKSAALRTTVSIDNRILGGFVGRGAAYNFMKIGDNKWSEVFGTHDDVTDSQLRNLYLNSRGFKRSLGG